MPVMESNPKAPRGRPVAAVERALTVLEVLAANPEGLGVSDVARRIGVNASSASRLLATLEEGNVVQRDATGRYRLGLHLVALADGVLARLDVRELARPLLRRLALETGESTTLSVPAGNEAITVDFVPSEASVVSMARLGRPSSAHATSVGKVMLAFGTGAPPAADAFDHLELTAYTPSTIVDPEALVVEVAAVRERGWAQAVGERDRDLSGVAVPVYGRSGELVAILGVQGPVPRLGAARVQEVLGPLRRASHDLSRALGGDGASPGTAGAGDGVD